MSFDSSNDGSNIAVWNNSDRSNGSSRPKSKEEGMEISPESSSNGRGDRKSSHSTTHRDQEKSASDSPSKFAKMDRRVSSRQGKRDRQSREERSPSTPPMRSRRSNSRENRRYKGRGDRRKSKERNKNRRDKRSRSRSRRRSPKRSRKSRRRHSSSSNSPDIMSTSLIGEITRQHGSDFVKSKKSKRSKRRRRQSSSSSSSSEEMHVETSNTSNGSILNIPTPMPPPSSIFYPTQIQPLFSQMAFPPPPVPPPVPPNDMFAVVPPPQPPPPMPIQVKELVFQSQYMVRPSIPGSSKEGLVPPPPLPMVTPTTSNVKQTRMMDGLPIPPQMDSKRIVSRPVLLNRRGVRANVEQTRDEWGSTRLTDYEMLEQIGEGTYGQVYKAVNKRTGVQVALKRVRLENEKEGFPITAIREIKILRQLNHKNIVRLMDIVTDDVAVRELKNSRVNFYLVFEYVDHDLMGLLESRELIDFSKEQVCLLFKQLLEGLAYCHKAGFLHRDIKCSNILVNNRGELKVADLGLARLWHEGIERPYTNRVITLWYRPPELLLGEEFYGPSIDVWSAGCMLGELFTRKPLFNGNNEMMQLDLISKICGTATQDVWPDVVKLKHWDNFKAKRFYPRRIREEFEHLMPPQAIDLLEKLLSLDPKKRLTAREALMHPWIRSVENLHVPPLNLPKHQDCHEMWSKKQKRAVGNNRLSAVNSQKRGGSVGSNSGPKASSPRASSRQSNGGGGSSSSANQHSNVPRSASNHQFQQQQSMQHTYFH